MQSTLRAGFFLRGRKSYIGTLPRFFCNQNSELVVSDTPLRSATEKVYGKKPEMGPKELLSIPLLTRPALPEDHRPHCRQ